MERREFIILAAAGASGTLALQGCGADPEEFKPLYIANDKYVPGADYWRATVCGQCAAGCGILVRTRDGKANKIEGNPLHPISRGKTCARGQAGLNELYNPDRIKHPLKRTGARGAGQFERIEWDEALQTLAGRLNELRARHQAQSVAWLEGGKTRGRFRSLVRQFMTAYGSDKVFEYHPFSRAVERRATLLSFGREWLPTYNLSGADYVLSFSARFLETWGSPVYYSREFGELRRGRRLRGRWVHAEPRLSLTAANADEWLPVRPGASGALALSLAHELARHNISPPPPFTSLEPFDPEKTQEKTGVSPATVRRLARELAESQAVVVLGGETAAAHTNGLFNLVAINYLSALVRGASQRRPFPPPLGPVSPVPSVAEAAPALEARLAAQASEIQVLFIHGANPLYTAPAAFNLRAAFEKIPLIVSFSSFEDETTGYADLILPDHTTLERWDDDEPEEGSSFNVISLAQPVVDPLYQTRHTGDVLLALARHVTSLATEFKAAGFVDFLKQYHLAGRKPEEATGHWEQAVLRGGVWPAEAIPSRSSAATAIEPAGPPVAARSAAPVNFMAAEIARLPSSASFAGDEKDFPYHLLPYEHLALGDGRTANQPLLQELPDPMTAVSWGSWVELHPETAAKHGIRQGDLVAIESPHGRIAAPAVIYPAIRPEVIAMPAGQGHARYGRYASGRGANPLEILAPLTEAQTGALAWAATRVRISKAEGQARLVTFGTDERLLEDQEGLRR